MKRIFFITILICSLSSCKVINTLTIDYLQPAHVTFPPEVKSVIVVNNILETEKGRSGKQYKSGNNEKFPNGFIEEMVQVEGDSKLTTETFAQHLAEGNYFDEVLVCDSVLRSNEYFSRETKISQQEVIELVNEFNVDIVLAVEDSKVSIERKPYFGFGYAGPSFAFDAVVTSRVRVYLPSRSEPMITISPKDSIFWVLNSPVVKEEMIREASSFAGVIPVKYIIPTWETADRSYYASGCVELRDATVWIKENNWQEALALWMKAYEKKNVTIKIRSAFNIALYYEMTDRLEEAKSWLLKAFELVESKQKKDANGIVLTPSEDYLLTYLYIMNIEERLKNTQKLELQMERFNNNF